MKNVLRNLVLLSLFFLGCMAYPPTPNATQTCGGFAGIQCLKGYTCKLDKARPDATGTCQKTSETQKGQPVQQIQAETQTPIRSYETRKDHAVRITQGPGSDQNPAFLEPHTLVFTRFSQGYNQGPADLMQLDLSTGNETVLLSNGAQNVNVNGRPFSPGRQRICYASDLADADEIWCMDLKSKTTARITHHDAESHYIEPSASEDNATLVFEVHSNAASDAPGQLWTTDYAGNAKVLLSDSADNRLPMYNPEDERILFQRKTGEFWRLTIRHQNGTLEELPIPTQGGTDATWSAAEEIVYSSEGNGLTHPKIFSYNVTSGIGRAETSDSSREDGAPAVSPDGKWLAFESHTQADENSPSRIWIIQRS